MNVNLYEEPQLKSGLDHKGKMGHRSKTNKFKWRERTHFDVQAP
jgi:hypothetical protein